MEPLAKGMDLQNVLLRLNLLDEGKSHFLSLLCQLFPVRTKWFLLDVILRPGVDGPCALVYEQLLGLTNF